MLILSFFQTKSNINFILLYFTLPNKNRSTVWTNNGKHKRLWDRFQENVGDLGEKYNICITGY